MEKKPVEQIEEPAPIEETEDEKKLRELLAKRKKLEKALKLYQDLLFQKKQNGNLINI